MNCGLKARSGQKISAHINFIMQTQTRDLHSNGDDSNSVVTVDLLR